MKNEKNKGKRTLLIVWLILIAVLVSAIFAIGLPSGEKEETITEVMQDGVLHEENRVNLFGLIVNPAVISGFVVSGILLVTAALIRIFAIPRFTYVPGKFQTVLEKTVEFFDGLAHANSPHKPNFVGAYIFAAGTYVCFSTLFELLGLQVLTTKGTSAPLPAPLADINGAIAMGVTSYLFILGGGIVHNGVKGGLSVLKDFSLPISMSFRLFGALLSGLLVTELVYYYVSLSFVLPVVVGVLFTLLHAVIQTYVLCTLVSIFYGEAVEPPKPKEKKVKEKKIKHQKEIA